MLVVSGCNTPTSSTQDSPVIVSAAPSLQTDSSTALWNANYGCDKSQPGSAVKAPGTGVVTALRQNGTGAERCGKDGRRCGNCCLHW